MPGSNTYGQWEYGESKNYFVSQQYFSDVFEYGGEEYGAGGVRAINAKISYFVSAVLRTSQDLGLDTEYGTMGYGGSVFWARGSSISYSVGALLLGSIQLTYRVGAHISAPLPGLLLGNLRDQIFEPQLIRSRAVRLGPRSSYQMNFDSQQMLYDIRRLSEIYYNIALLLNSEITSIQEGVDLTPVIYHRVPIHPVVPIVSDDTIVVPSSSSHPGEPNKIREDTLEESIPGTENLTQRLWRIRQRVGELERNG